jgi:hypothetical protein
MTSVGSAGSAMWKTVGGSADADATGNALVAVTVNAVLPVVVPPDVTVPVGWFA